MRKFYLKEILLLVVGLILGYSSHPKSLPTTIIEKDTIIVKDTVFVKASVPSLSKENVLLELLKQEVPFPKIVLAQSIHETGNYKSRLCRVNNNIFGMKHRNKYKKYNNYIECIADYKKRISSRYRKGEDYYQFLKRIGYASDPEYNSRIKKLV